MINNDEILETPETILYGFFAFCGESYFNSTVFHKNNNAPHEMCLNINYFDENINFLFSIVESCH